MNMFFGINKKVLIYIPVVLVAVLFGGLVLYKYIAVSSPVEVKNVAGGVQTEQTPSPSSSPSSEVNQPAVNVSGVKMQADENEIIGKNGDNGFSVCMDKCGDGICQEADEACSKSGDLNCACFETPQECPQDCN